MMKFLSPFILLSVCCFSFAYSHYIWTGSFHTHDSLPDIAISASLDAKGHFAAWNTQNVFCFTTIEGTITKSGQCSLDLRSPCYRLFCHSSACNATFPDSSHLQINGMYSCIKNHETGNFDMELTREKQKVQG